MAYKRAETNSFAEFQMSPGEGFGAAVTGDINSTRAVSKLAISEMNKLPAGLQGLKGYEGYPQSLAGFPQFSGEFGDETLTQASNLAIKNMDRTPAGLQGFEGFEGFEGAEDDAFAGYGDTFIEITETENDDEPYAFDGYGGLGETAEESFYTFFHQAAMARTDTDLINLLAKAVKVVPDDTPAAIKKKYYDLAKEMLEKKKNSNLRHLDLQRAEIESNLGWLINSSIPKTGGFNAVVQKAIGRVGGKLAEGTKAQIKAENNLALGKKLSANVKKYNQLNGLGETSKLTYLGLGITGILAVGIAYYMFSQKPATTSKKRKRKKS